MIRATVVLAALKKPTGWLPPELRCATYSGLGEIPLTIEDEALDEVA
jgi:hypothetical protein